MSPPQHGAPSTDGIHSQDETPKNGNAQLGVATPLASSVSATSQRAEMCFPFLKLPGEIRVYIYNYAIDCNEINSTLGGTSQLGKSSKRPKLRQPPSLLLLDHQTRFEAIAELQKCTLVLQEQEDNSPISHLGVVLTRNAMLQLRQVVLTFDKGNETSRIIPYKELLHTTSLPESQLQYFDIYIKQPKWSMSWRIHKRAKVVLQWIIDPPTSAPMQKEIYWVDNRDALPTLDGTLPLIRWALRREIWLWNVIIPGLTSQDCGMDDVLETL